jgi:hypothetical protein
MGAMGVSGGGLAGISAMTGMGSAGGTGGAGGAMLADDGHESSLMPASSGTGMQSSGSDAD